MLSRNKVHSIKNIKLVEEQDFMKKLNKRKIKWILREVERRDKGLWTIGQIQKITPQHVCRVYRKYKDCKDPILKKCGRKPKTITEEERAIRYTKEKGKKTLDSKVLSTAIRHHLYDNVLYFVESNGSNDVSNEHIERTVEKERYPAKV